MRLLHTRTFELQEFNESNKPPYAILSHRWSSEEVQFEDRALLKKYYMTGHTGVQKILGFCKKAAELELDYGWVDTCCIDKSSSAELSESINSMFEWYKNADICLVHLADVVLPPSSGAESRNEKGLPPSFAESDWFKRGWTLQELLAPQKLRFYSSKWEFLGLKSNLGKALSTITTIDRDILRGADISRASIAKRMSWASHRMTTRTEDVAYCLLGIMGVNMPLLYGEGERAFVRLQEEIMKNSDDQSLFAWTDEVLDEDSPQIVRHNYDLYRSPFAQSPSEFAQSGDILPYRSYHNGQPYAMTNLGLRIEVPLHSLRHIGGIYLAELACHRENDYTGSLGIYVRSMKNNQFGRVHARDMRAPVLVDLQSVHRTNHTPIYLRKDSIVHGGEEIDRHHGILVRVHEDRENGYQIKKVTPRDHWKKTKGNTALILNSAQDIVIYLESDKKKNIALLVRHELAQGISKDAVYNAWEAGRERCKFIQQDSSLGGEFFEEIMESRNVSWGIDWRENFIAKILASSSSKTYTDLPEKRRVVAEMRKDVIMGERMIVVDITFYEDSEGLYELHEECVPRTQATEQDPMSMALDGLPPPSVQHKFSFWRRIF